MSKEWGSNVLTWFKLRYVIVKTRLSCAVHCKMLGTYQESSVVNIDVLYVVLLFSFTYIKHTYIAILIWCIYLLRIYLIILLWDMLFINLQPHVPEMRIRFVYFLFVITKSRVKKINFAVLFYFLGAIPFCSWMYLGGFIVCKVHR